MIAEFLNQKRLAGRFLAIALGTGALISGCGNTSPATAPASETAAEKAAADVPAKSDQDTSALLAAIAESNDIIAWYTVREQYLAGTDRNADVDAALAEKEKALLEKTPAQSVSDAVELLGFSWKLDGTSSSEGKPENFNATWLFRAKQDVQLEKGIDVKLVLRGWPDKSHRHYLQEAGFKEDRYFEKTYDLQPPLSQWKSGEYYLVKKQIKPVVPNVPYRMHTIYPQVKVNEDGTSGGHAGPYSELTDMGWFVDLGK